MRLLFDKALKLRLFLRKLIGVNLLMNLETSVEIATRLDLLSVRQPMLYVGMLSLSKIDSQILSLYLSSLTQRL